MQIPNESEESLEIFYKKRNRLFIYDNTVISAFNINEILGNNRDLSIVYGLPYSGKTVIAKNLESKHGYTVLDFVVFIEQIKEIRAGPEGDKDSITVDFKMFLEEFNNKLNSIPKNQKLLLENITKIVTKEEELLALLLVSGPPRVFFNLVCDNVPLIDRYKTIAGVGDEFTDEQKEEYMRTNFEFPKKIIEILKNQSVTRVDINTNSSDNKTFNIVQEILGKKFVVINHQYRIDLENTLYHIATTHKILFINVPSLIKKHLDEETDFAAKLRNSYNEVRIWNDLAETERIYYIYNPIHYESKVVGDMINDYALKNGKENEAHKNIILLTGYLNYGLLNQKSQSLNLPLLEVHKLLGLGKLINDYEFIRRNLFLYKPF